MRILLSNDDGVHSVGLQIIARELRKLGEVWVVAPLEEKSTTGHSLTIHKPLRMIPMGHRFYGVSGSPADCVYLGIREVLGKMPDLVVSGSIAAPTSDRMFITPEPSLPRARRASSGCARWR